MNSPEFLIFGTSILC